MSRYKLRFITCNYVHKDAYDRCLILKNLNKSDEVIRGILSGYKEVKGIRFLRMMNLIGAVSLAVMGFGAWAFVPGAREFLFDRIAFFVVGIAMYIWGGVKQLNNVLYSHITYLLVCLFMVHSIMIAGLNSFHAGYSIPTLVIGQTLSLSFRNRYESMWFAVIATFVAIAIVLYLPDISYRESGLFVFLLLISLAVNVVLIGFKSYFIEHIKLNRDMLRSLVNATETAIFVTDVRGHIQDCNQRALDLFDYPQEDLAGKDFRILRQIPLDEQEVITGLDELERGGFWNSESLLMRKDGSTFDAHLSVAMLCRKDQRYLVYRVRDYTKVKAFEKELLRAKDQAEAAAAVRSQFLATMSHEIRTPLNGVVGMASLLDHTPLNFWQKEYVDTIQKSGQSLMVLINDILDYSKFEHGNLSLREDDTRVGDAVIEVCDLLRTHADQKGVRLETHLSGDLPKMIRTDEGRLKQVLLNLVGNAVKFTDYGCIKVSCEQVSKVNESIIIRFTVQDTGIGIPAASQSQLFQPFVQVHSEGSKKYGGTGLGLAISRQIIEMLGGEIEVISEEGKGTTFSFTIKANVSESSCQGNYRALTDTSNSEAESVLPSLNVLIAEDNLINQSVLLYTLEVLGMKADVVGNGTEVIRQVAMKRYDIIFMDMQMPEMDGLLASSWIREHSNYQPYIICMTANSSEADRLRCMDAGMNDFVPKPCDLARMKASLYRWYDQSPQRVKAA